MFQVTNTRVCCYKDIMEKHLAPCVSQLAIAAGKHNLWKLINRDLLLKAKDKDAKVCYVTVVYQTDCMLWQEIHSTLVSFTLL